MRADITLAMRSAMSEAPQSEPAPTQAASDPSPAETALPPSPAPRTLRGRLFGRVADYARRYLTSSLEHRLTLMFQEVARLQIQADATLRRLDDAAARFERFEAAFGQVSAAQQQAALAQHTETEQTLAAAREVLGTLSLFGGRFDELEIKARPMIAFDEASYAVRLREGYVFLPRAHPMFAVMVANATSEGLEPGVRRVLRALILPGMAAADVGANVGLLTLAMADRTGPTGRVYAFEPEAGPRAQLEKMLRLNGLKWVEVFDVALGAEAAQATFYVSPIIGHSSLYQLPEAEASIAQAIKVQVRRLDELLAPGAALDVVKMDVEGAELDVLAGMDRVMAENRDIALVAEFGPSHLARTGWTVEGWFEEFRRRGFSAFEIVEPTGVCRQADPIALARCESANLVFVRPGGAAAARLPA